MQDIMKSIQRIDEAIQVYYTKSSDKYAHIDASDIEKANKILNDKQTWYDQTANRFAKLEAHQDAPILCSNIKQERDVSIFMINYSHDSKILFLDTRKRMLGYFK